MDNMCGDDDEMRWSDLEGFPPLDLLMFLTPHALIILRKILAFSQF
jgi:hypothetical protein